MVSCTSAEQSHAVTSGMEETHASKQQEQSSIPMNYPSKEFIPVDKRNWDDIRAVDNVERESSFSENLEEVDSIFTAWRTSTRS